MNNEEKAATIGITVRDFFVSSGVSRDNAETASELSQHCAMQMAEWKDQQVIELIDKKLDHVRSKIEEMHDKVGKLKYEGMWKILLELKNDMKN